MNRCRDCRHGIMTTDEDGETSGECGVVLPFWVPLPIADYNRWIMPEYGAKCSAFSKKELARSGGCIEDLAKVSSEGRMSALCDAYDEPESRWWRYGEYVGKACPKCGRERLMQCEQVIDVRVSVERIICEKCCWEPARNDYCAEALSDR